MVILRHNPNSIAHFPEKPNYILASKICNKISAENEISLDVLPGNKCKGFLVQ